MPASSTTDARRAAATRHMQSGAYQAALQIYETLLAETPDDADVLNDAAIGYLQKNDARTAQRYLQKALAVDPSCENAFFNLIKFHLLQQDVIGAALSFHEYETSICDSPRKKSLATRLWPNYTLTDSIIDTHQGINSHAIKTIYDSWGNKGWSANMEFATEMIRYAHTCPGAILECGSGFTTLLLAHLAEELSLDIWVLEHHKKWHSYMQVRLERQGVEGIHLVYAPLRNFGDFAWYDVPLKEMPQHFNLVVCDGPPGNTPGGRYGLFPIMNTHLEDHCTILLDDVHRDTERQIMEHWATEGQFTTRIVADTTKSFGILER